MEVLVILTVVVIAIVIIVSESKKNSNNGIEFKKTSKKSRKIRYFEKKLESIYDLFDSNNENDWRIAIIEFDILINKIMTFSGVLGDNHMEKINNLSSKKINKNTLFFLHRIRNRVAHQGIEFSLDRDKVNQIKDSFDNAFMKIN